MIQHECLVIPDMLQLMNMQDYKAEIILCPAGAFFRNQNFCHQTRYSVIRYKRMTSDYTTKRTDFETTFKSVAVGNLNLRKTI